jgi:colanic acid/amylovoran biosynthesis glycosyltransferase
MKCICIVNRVFLLDSEVWVLRHMQGVKKFKVVGLAEKYAKSVHVEDRRTCFVLSVLLHVLRGVNKFCKLLIGVPSLGGNAFFKLFSKYYNIKLIHIHFMWNISWFMDLFGPVKIPVVVTAHGTDVNRAIVDQEYKKYMLKYIEHVDYIICISWFIHKQLLRIGIKENKLITNYLGVTLPNIIKKEHQGIVLTCVSSFGPEKGHVHLIEVFARVLSMTHKCHEKIVLWLIGDGPLKADLVELAARLGVADSIVFWGILSQSAVMERLSESDIYVQHSVVFQSGTMRKEEGLSVSLCEAATMGLPIVCTNVGGCAEICRDGKNGYTVEPDDAGAMSEKIIALIKDHDLRTRMGMAGRYIVESEFSQEKSIAFLERLYLQLMN